jgi:hypothetical protein
MSKEIIRISKDVREAHKRLFALEATVPKELPADIEIKTSSVKVSDLDLGTWVIERIKFGWPGFRIEIYLRKFVDGRRGIEQVKIRRAKQTQALLYVGDALEGYWKS